MQYRGSGSTTVGVGLANGARFGLMLRDKDLGGRLMLNGNGLTLTNKGSPTAQPALVTAPDVNGW
ncbi:MAG: hypothetical protein ACREA4_04325 [Nitrososphaera sp.]